MNEQYDLLKNKYSKSKNIFLKKGNSIELMKTYPNDYFDIIYIDGDHSYDGVTNDLKESLRIIKNGGIICGHDYEMNTEKTQNYYEFGVKQAVDEFCVKNNLKITHKAYDGCISFGIDIFKN